MSIKLERKNVWDGASSELKKEIFDFSEGYKNYLNRGKTERECVSYSVSLLRENGFVSLEEKEKLLPGDRVYVVNRNKNVFAAIIGQKPVCEGFSLIAAHIDSPRLDLKPQPIYEDQELCLLKTHYYGGIKKYQWTSIPLALHGVVCKTDGTTVDVVIGEAPSDPIFTVTDLLPHLAREQSEKKLGQAITGEALNVLIGSIPTEDSEEKEKVKAAILKIIFEKYGITEADFVSAEIEAVPAFSAQDLGLDRSMVGGYGQDDRVCSYAALIGLLDINDAPKKTAICFLADKEEIGSSGNTGMRSRFFENCIAELCALTSAEPYSDLMLRRALRHAKCLSADVGAATDPTYPEVSDRKNAAFMNYGVFLMKYTGSGGKSGSSDADAEFVAKIRALFDTNGVVWQTGELGKVDMGGGGTVAHYLAALDIDVIDCGTPILSMHAPFEVASKADLYMTYRAYSVFYQA